MIVRRRWGDKKDFFRVNVTFFFCCEKGIFKLSRRILMVGLFVVSLHFFGTVTAADSKGWSRFSTVKNPNRMAGQEACISSRRRSDDL